MYDELVKVLRETDFSDGCPCEAEPMCASAACIIAQAADAIEELTRENESLAKSVNEASEILRKRWIPVEERLPDQSDNRLYICLIVSGEYDQLSWYELCDFAEGQFWIRDQLYGGHVTHWMPLPEPPQEE